MNRTSPVLHKAVESAASTFMFTWFLWSRMFWRVVATAFFCAVVVAIGLAHLVVYGLHGIQHAL